MKTLFKNPVYVFIALGAAFLVFDVSYYALAHLPGTRNLACVEGGYLTAGNVLFSVVFAILLGIFAAGFVRLFRIRTETKKATLMSLSGVGLLVGMLTTFCTVCTIPVISFFGLSVGLGAFTTFNVYFKVFSLASILYALYLLHKQIQGDCACEVEVA